MHSYVIIFTNLYKTVYPRIKLRRVGPTPFNMTIYKTEFFTTQPIVITTCICTIHYNLSYLLIVDKKFIICLLKTVKYSKHFREMFS